MPNGNIDLMGVNITLYELTLTRYRNLLDQERKECMNLHCKISMMKAGGCIHVDVFSVLYKINLKLHYL